jgi:membrane associated rhomboid family serine protease
MDIAPPGPDPGQTAVNFDRERIHHAVFGAAILVLGIWLVWLGGWLLGWPMSDLGVEPRRLGGLVGVFSAPLVHASFAHLMSNTLPLALLACLMLYAYPRAARTALPMIWLLAGLGVWLFARASVHVGMSGINHGLMFFLFLTGMLRRDRLGVVISLVVFFFYGGMLLTVLPREEQVSFEYHLSGAVSGVLAAILLFRLDPKPARKRYSWEDEEEEDASADAEFDLPRPDAVPVLWKRDPETTENGRILRFPSPGGDVDGSGRLHQGRDTPGRSA